MAMISLRWDFLCADYGATIGQNGAWGYKDWEGALGAWSGEAEIYHFGRDPESYLPGGRTWQDIGHYTQVCRQSQM